MPSPSPLDTFDPFATHPFTNNSGTPAAHKKSAPPTRKPIHSPQTIVHAQPISHPQPLPISQPTPTRPSQNVSSAPNFPPTKKPGPGRHGIFVPFRQDTASPDLVLKNKSLSKQNA